MIFLCENNRYAEMTPIEQEVKVGRMSVRAEGNGIPAVEVDGNDVTAVYEVTRAAAEQARQGGGPTFIEAHTYRLSGHMVGDLETYRDRAEVDEWRQRDPLRRVHDQLRMEHGCDEAALNRLEQEGQDVIDDAEAFGRSSPFPEAATATDYLYA